VKWSELAEPGTNQVIEGTYLVEDTKKSLGQILDVSYQIDALVHRFLECYTQA